MANYDLTYEGSRVQGILDTGDELRDAGYIFLGEATPSTVPGTPTERVAYIGGPGTYTNFGSSITVGAGCICVFKYTGSAWSNQVINTGLSDAISSEASARQLGDSTLQGGINTVSAAITAINNAIGNGCVYAGIATPSSTPASGKVFYFAFTAGTYTNFNSLEVPQGINILKNNGSTWLLDSFSIIDDAPTQGSDNLVKSGGVLNSIIQNGPAFDLSAYNAQGGTLATYADLSAALTALNALPADFKKGGMSMKYVQTSDNKYVQYRNMNEDWSTDTEDWAINDGGVYVENPEWIYVILDDEKHILGGIKTDGHVEWSKGVPTPVKSYIGTQIANSIVVERTRAESAEQALSGAIALKVDKVTGKSLIDADYANNVSYIDNDEYLYVLLDSQNHILEAITATGEYINNLSNNGNTTEVSAEIPKSAGEYSLGHSELDNLQYDYNVLIIDGQSLSVGSETSVARQTVGNDYCYMLGNNIWVGVNENPVAGATLHKLVSGATNNVPKENCLTTAVLSLSEKLANDGTPKKFIAISVGQGGASIEELMKGASSGYYANRFLAGINRLKAIADSENKTIGVFSIVWMQGESNGSTPTSEYKTKLLQLRNDMVSDVATVFEQTTIPSFLMYGSFSRLFFDYDPQIAMQELAAENNSMFMSNPIYNIPAYRYGHLSSNGCVWFGEYIAKSLYALSHNEEPHIMRILGAYFINDTTIVVKIDTPVLPIVFDTATWASVQNYGFAVFKDGTEVTISSVENMGNEVIIKLQNDRVEGSTYRLEYVKESARADVRYGNVRDSSKYSPLYKYANDANEVGSVLYGGWEEVEYDPSIDYTVIEEGEYPSLYTVGQYVSENVNGTVKYFRCTSQTDFPPYAYVSNRPQNISVGDKFSLYNWLIPFKGNIN